MMRKYFWDREVTVTHTDIFPKLMSFQHPLCQKFTCLSLKKVKILQHEILSALKNPYFTFQKKNTKQQLVTQILKLNFTSTKLLHTHLNTPKVIINAARNHAITSEQSKVHHRQETTTKHA
ncbi:hypothetical protein V8G54_025915 [Vigna mungo]|uniref:Uncharacterized protein n=1 Tax=Vigna mungo TaxID=3915 RepID=A0AAQ3MZE6_VIGMU